MPAPRRVPVSETTLPSFASRLDPADVVDAQVCVRDVSGRNSVTRVDVVGRGGGMVYKASATARVEARVIGVLARDAEVRPHLPTVVAVDDEGITFAALDARSIFSGAVDGLQPAEASAAQLGTALARLHSGSTEGLPSAPTPYPFASGWPWVEDLIDMSWGDCEVIEIIQNSDALHSRVHEVRAGWRPTAPIHGDIRDANVMVDDDDPTQVTLIDWETGGCGDPAWDIASALGERLGTWIVAGERHPAGPAGADAFELVRVMSSVWDAYRPAPAADDEMLERALRWIPVRLVQRALEATASTLQASATTRATLQMAENLCLQPERLRRGILGR